MDEGVRKKAVRKKKALMKRKSINRYRAGLRAAMRGLWSGAFDRDEFFVAMERTIRLRLTQAWAAGLRECGFRPEEMSDTEQDRLQDIIFEEIGFVEGVAAWIEKNNRAAGKKLGTVLRRAEMWVSKYEQVRSIAQSIACADRKLKWVWNPAKDHCGDCANYNGRVYRGSVWARWSIEPKSRSLECGGLHCGCRFEQTDEPITSGRPPAMRGR
jgi:hypothetical protein